MPSKRPTIAKYYGPFEELLKKAGIDVSQAGQAVSSRLAATRRGGAGLHGGAAPPHCPGTSQVLYGAFAGPMQLSAVRDSAFRGEPMLRIEHLSKIYPNGTVALTDVSFQVEDGEFLAVIGLSGSGKSTLLRCINRLIEPTSGKVIWNDVDAHRRCPSPRCARSAARSAWSSSSSTWSSAPRCSTNVLAGRLGYINPYQSLFNYFSPAGPPARPGQPGAAWAQRQGPRPRRLALRRAAAARGHRPRADAGAQAGPGRRAGGLAGPGAGRIRSSSTWSR